MEVAVVDRNQKLLRFIKIRFGGAPIKSVSPVLNEFFKPKRVNIGKAKLPKQDPICGRIGEKVISNHSHMAQNNLCAKLFGFSPTVLGNQARGANLMEAGRAENG